MRRPVYFLALLTSLVFLGVPAGAQAQAAAAADVASPEAVVHALYESVQRAPGENYKWDRMRGLFLPGARMISNPEQTGGVFMVLTVEEFIELIDAATVVGGAGDRGFAEEQIASRVERYGDIAHVFSTYQKRFHDDTTILGRGINSIQLIQHDGRWWVTHIIWDEETGAGPVPSEYRQGRG